MVLNPALPWLQCVNMVLLQITMVITAFWDSACVGGAHGAWVVEISVVALYTNCAELRAYWRRRRRCPPAWRHTSPAWRRQRCPPAALRWFPS